MGIYTVHNDPRVDEQLQTRINLFASSIVKRFPEVYSIILTGGFGKGEGSVRQSGGTVRPLRDFDFIVVFDKSVPRREFEDFQRTLIPTQPTSVDQYKYGEEFSIDVHATTLRNLNCYPDIVTFDCKQSRIVYGQDVKGKIAVESEDIPLRSGARLLFQKSTALIGAMNHEYLSGEQDLKKDLESFVRETSKVYVEIGAALTILVGQYQSRALDRLETLKNIYEDKFSELSRTCPSLMKNIKESTIRKVDPDSAPMPTEPIEYWFRARDDLGEVIKYYFNIYLGIQFKEWISYSHVLRTRLEKVYFVPLIEAVLRSRKVPYNSLSLGSLNLLYNIKENIDQGMNRREMYNLYSLLISRSSLSIRFFCSCLPTMFSLRPDGTVSKDLLDEANRELAFVKSKRDRPASWTDARLKSLVLMNSLNFL